MLLVIGNKDQARADRCAGTRRRMKYKRDRPDEAFLAPWTARMREAPGDTAYIATFESGYGLSTEQAAAEALAWLGKRSDG